MSEKKGRTLWEIMFGSKEPEVVPAWKQITNPLEVKVGQFVNLDMLDYRGRNFAIKEIVAYKVRVGSDIFNYAEYVLADGAGAAFLRVIPSSDSVKAIVLTKYDEFGFDTEDGQAITGIVKDPAGDFNVDIDAENVHEQYWRVDDVKSSYIATLQIVTSDDPDATLSQRKVEYWDYWRDTEEDSVKITQYLYVEMDKDNGWMVIKRGEELDPSRVQVY